MRLMIVTNSKSSGGAERVMNQLANRFYENGNEVLLVPINSSSEDLIKVNCDLWSPERKWRGGLWQTIVAFVKMQQHVHKWQPEFIILNCDIAELMGSILMTRAKFLVVEHSPQPWSGREFLGRLIRAIMRWRGFRFTAVSKHLTIWPKSRQPEMIFPNLLNDLATEPFGNSKRNIERLVFIGRLSPEKGPFEALRIAMTTKLPIAFYGGGVLEAELKKESQVQDVVCFIHGFVPKVWNKINETDLLLVPSKYEGDGLVIIEALRMNVPMLVSDIPDFRRFNLNELAYCASVLDYSEKIEAYKNDTSSLTSSPTILDEILEERQSHSIVDSWLKYLSQLK